MQPARLSWIVVCLGGSPDLEYHGLKDKQTLDNFLTLARVIVALRAFLVDVILLPRAGLV